MDIIAFLFAVVGDLAVFRHTFVVVIVPVDDPLVRPIVLMHVYGHIGVHVSGIVIRGFHIIPCYNLHNFRSGFFCFKDSGAACYLVDTHDWDRWIQLGADSCLNVDTVGSICRCWRNL